MVCAAVVALKNPSCRMAAEGRAQELDWSALCAPAKYEVVVPLHAYTFAHDPASRQIITVIVSHAETACPPVVSWGNRQGNRKDQSRS
jgi:hypothetical protein